MAKQIFLPDEVKKEVAKTFKVSYVTLWNALTFKTRSDRARMLRAAALQRGGVMYDPDKATPNFTTSFETSEGTMTQMFSERVYLAANLKSNIVKVYQDNEVINVHENVTLADLAAIQDYVQNIANQLK